MLVLIGSDCDPDAMYLHVKVGNNGAKALYETKGFQKLKHKPLHYRILGKRFDAIKMGLGITDKGRRHIEDFGNTWTVWLYSLLGMEYNAELDELIRDDTKKVET